MYAGVWPPRLKQRKGHREAVAEQQVRAYAVIAGAPCMLMQVANNGWNDG